VGYIPDYIGLLQHIMMTNPIKCAEFATQLANDESGPLVDIERVVDIFMSQNMIQPANSCFEREQAGAGPPADAPPQNEPCLCQVADAILSSHIMIVPGLPIFAKRPVCCKGYVFTCYVVGFLILTQAIKALEHLADIKRVIMHTNVLQPEVSVAISEG